MPELPEVETVKESLKKRLIGECINKIDIYHNGIIAYPDITSFKTNIVSQTINDIRRRGKFLMFVLDDYYLLSHLRMEGKYFFKNKNDKLDKHEHVVFTLDNEELRYKDVRKFGKMYLIKKEDINEIGPLKDLGLEPDSNELTVSYLKEKYNNKKLPIKSVLLDQSIIVGIGNIYADEILFLSKINPLTKSNQLTDDNLKGIIKNTSIVLNKAIKLGGSTIRSYTSVDGISGKFQNELNVHGKLHSKCSICKSEILKIKVGGRGTYFCSKCQK